MPFYTYSSSWRQIKKAWVYASNAWQPVKKGWVWVSNQWRLFFSGENVPSIAQQVTIAQSAPDALDGLITLTGTNYHWTDATSLTYYFEWSSDGGSTWSTIDTGSITNPISGSSNQKFYTVTIANTSPNIDNLYRFRVYAINITLTNSSTSSTTTISTPRNITNVSASQVGNTLQASVSFTTGLYTNSIRVTTNRYNGATFVSSSTTDLAAASPASITLPAYNQTYKFQITPYTQTLLSGNVRGYPGNQTAETTGLVIGAAPAPSQSTKPTLSSTGSVVAGTVLTASNGTYSNASSVTTRVYGWYPAPSLTDGTTTYPNPNQISTNLSFTTAQYLQNYVFYAVDIVLGINGSTYYYFSTLSATVYLPSFTDNFNRANTTGSQGIGQTSGGSWYWSNDSVGTYGWMMPTIDQNNFSWQIDNNTVYTTKNPSFADTVSDYPMKSIDVGDSNVSVSASVPDGGGGPGLVYWVTGAGSWWATVPSYYYQSITTYSCYTPVTSYSCYTPSYSCYTPQTVTTYSCGGSATTSFCPDNFTTEYNASTVGRRCSSCTTNTTYSYTCGTDQYVSSDPGTVVACNSPSHNGQPCYKLFVGEFGIQWIVRYCSVTSSSTYSYNTVSSSTTTACTGGPISTNAGGSGCGGCSVTTTCSGGPISTNAGGSGCGGCAVSSSTTCSGGPISTNAGGSGCGGCSVTPSTTTTYYSRIRILSATGSSVTSMAEQTIATSTSSYQKIYGISTDTSNNTITAKAYSTTNLSTQMGSTLIYTAINPQKISGGQSAVGIINSPTDDNRQTGNRLDNFTYTNV